MANSLIPNRARASLRRLGLLFFFGVQMAQVGDAELVPLPGYVPHPVHTITFTKNIAPIIFQHCAGCHRPGESGPFDLLNYTAVRKHSQSIAEVVTRRIMPPWQPEAGYGEFAGDRRLSVEQIGQIQQWTAESTIEGDPKDLSDPPTWTEGWQLGQPDLVLSVPEPYQLPETGRDVYWNFVIATRLDRPRFVRAMEFRPKNRSVHHASLFIDPTPESRLRDAKDPKPGFGGMDLPGTARTPDGQFLSWQPGRAPYASRPGSAWILPKGADLVLQLHLRPSGKKELIQPEVGLYFTDQPPTEHLYKILLGSKQIDIPPGMANYQVEDSYRLPVPVRVTGLNPHAHYLGKDLQGFARLPDGTRKWLIWIKNWKFFWQGDYQLQTPLDLPAGTVLGMRYTFDNSEANPENPNHPPGRVQFGTQTSDEMAELWIQVAADPAALATLAKDCSKRVLRDIVSTSEARLRLNANDAGAHTRLGSIKLAEGATSEALTHLQAAMAADPSLDEPHYLMGVIYRKENQLLEASREFRKAVELNPASYKAYGNLGFIAEEQGQWSEAEKHFRKALEIYPQDSLASSSLAELLQAKKNLQGANRQTPGRSE